MGQNNVVKLQKIMKIVFWQRQKLAQNMVDNDSSYFSERTQISSLDNEQWLSAKSPSDVQYDMLGNLFAVWFSLHPTP